MTTTTAGRSGADLYASARVCVPARVLEKGYDERQESRNSTG